MKRRRRNPDSAPAVRRSSGGLKNWLILGVVGGGAYFIYKKFSASDVRKEIENATKGKRIPDPDLNGPLVTKFEIASTRSPICISSAVKGFVYSPVTSTNPVTGYSTFSATAAGHFTRRLLCSGGKKWVEIKPSAGLSGLFGLSGAAARRLD